MKSISGTVPLLQEMKLVIPHAYTLNLLNKIMLPYFWNKKVCSEQQKRRNEGSLGNFTDKINYELSQKLEIKQALFCQIFYFL